MFKTLFSDLKQEREFEKESASLDKQSLNGKSQENSIVNTLSFLKKNYHYKVSSFGRKHNKNSKFYSLLIKHKQLSIPQDYPFKDPIVEKFNSLSVEHYDANKLVLAPIQNTLNFLIDLALKDLPEDARILCVGVGTGADIIDLAKNHKGWRFVGIEPAESMIEGCKMKLRREGLEDRCELFRGYLSDFRADTKFDAVTNLLVMHFIKDMEIRKQMYIDMYNVLKDGGHMIVEEISGDVNSSEFDSLVVNWATLNGKLEDKEVDIMKKMYKESLPILHPLETERLMKEGGFKPVLFFQSLLFRAWHCKK